MNGQHLRAFLWLRWRLRVNQLKRGGIANAVILTILAIAAIVSAAVLFVVFLAIGLFALSRVSPIVLMLTLDGVVFVFLSFWTTGLLTELQRSEPLSLEKFLHLPVSLPKAFLINYLSSLASVSLLCFLSAILGLSLGLFFSRGWVMLLLLPMLAAFVLMVTALTYQLQGWLAALMANPRRRRTIIVAATMIFLLLILVQNLPSLMSFWDWQSQEQNEEPRVFQEHAQKREELQHDLDTKKITFEELAERSKKIEDELGARLRKMDEERVRRMERTYDLMNLILPPGWLPGGVKAAAQGRMGLILLAILGPALIGTASLYRAYRTTLRLYTGQYTSTLPARSASKGERQPLLALRAGRTVRRSPGLLEKRLPWLSEQAAVITLAAFRSLLRAPEAKMLLLSPVLLLLIFGSMFLARGRTDLPEAARPLLAFGAMAMVLFSMAQLIGNQFGFDRNGFRVFVLCPARRRDILLGKNLAVAPLALALGAAAAGVLQVIYPMHLDHFLALAPRFVSMYLLYCLPANAMSIFSPMRVAATSFKVTQPSGIAILWQLLFMFLLPAVLAPALLPLGIEWVAEEMGWLHGMPLDLILSVLECAAIVYIYGLILRWQGDWLQAREQRILQIVTARTE